ncbi:MAG: DUF1902 domain-containing protein [Defluviitaleaceae bacterium]|nr:DUF1902 domain-containing protein [Defluviitaleaceae bacterium]
MTDYNIDVHWDDEAGVWYAVCDDIPLAMESNSFDALIARVKIAVPEILEMNDLLNEGIRLRFSTSHVESIV